MGRPVRRGMTFPDLYILRHGETTWNAEGRMQGALDAPLTARGEAQARRQAAILGQADLTGFSAYSSPQGRALTTAALAVVPHLRLVRTDDRLCEIGVGDWQGRLRRELVTGDLVEGPDGDLSLYARAPGGEGFDRLEARCRDFLAGLTGPAVIVTHGITSRMLRAVALGQGQAGLAELGGGQGNVFFLSGGVQRELT